MSILGLYFHWLFWSSLVNPQDGICLLSTKAKLSCSRQVKLTGFSAQVAKLWELVEAKKNSVLLPEHVWCLHLCCRYLTDRPILNGITFDVPAGKSVAIVGTSGSGNISLTSSVTFLLIPIYILILAECFLFSNAWFHFHCSVPLNKLPSKSLRGEMFWHSALLIEMCTGKSTILRLLYRFFDCQSGSVSIGGFVVVPWLILAQPFFSSNVFMPTFRSPVEYQSPLLKLFACHFCSKPLAH